MKRLICFLLVTSCFCFKAGAQLDTAIIEKTGWLVYDIGHVIWYEANLKRCAQDKIFFDISNYPNGLILDAMSLAKYYKSVANSYSFLGLSSYDTVTNKKEYTIPDSICIIPVRVKYKAHNRPVSELLQPMGVSFKRGEKEVTLTYNYETNYDILSVELLRKKDKRRLKRVKNYVIFPPH